MSDCVQIAIVNDANFREEVMQNALPVIVIFQKSYWGATHIMKPILEKIASDYAGRVKVCKYNLDENSVTSAYYGIENSVAVLLFDKGNIIYKTGIIPKDEFKNIINSYLDNVFTK